MVDLERSQPTRAATPCPSTALRRAARPVGRLGRQPRGRTGWPTTGPRRTPLPSTGCPGVRARPPTRSGHELDVATPVLVDRVRGPERMMEAEGVDVLLLSTGPDLPYLTGYAAMPLGAAHDVRAPPRRRGHAGRAPAGGAPRGRAARGLLDPAVGGDRGPDRRRRPPRQGRRGRRHRRPHLGPLPRRPAGAAAGHHVPPGCGGDVAAAQPQGRRRDRCAARRRRRPPTGWPPSCRRARSRWSGGPRPRCRPTSRSG